MMFAIILLAALTTATVDPVDPIEACEAASAVLKDMRYVEGKYAEPGDFSHPKIKARLASCVEIALLAVPHGEEVVFTSIAIAYNETNFRKGVAGKAGELGRMQVMPKHHCKPYDDLRDGEGCTDPERAGVRAIRLLLRKHKLETALRLYNGSRAYGKKVAGFVKAIRRSYERHTQLTTKG